MLALTAACKARLRPVPLQVVATAKRAGHDVEVMTTPDGKLYTRRPDQTPEPYPIVTYDRVSGALKRVVMATPTAPLRRANR